MYGILFYISRISGKSEGVKEWWKVAGDIFRVGHSPDRLQNLLAIGTSHLLGIDALIGMCTGSIPMVGGHGTAGAFGPVLEDLNVEGATTICTAAATFGLIAGSLVGGPLGRKLIEKKNLLDTVVPEDDSLLVEDERNMSVIRICMHLQCSADSGNRTGTVFPGF